MHPRMQVGLAQAAGSPPHAARGAASPSRGRSDWAGSGVDAELQVAPRPLPQAPLPLVVAYLLFL